jgi:hypothetical protein
MDSVFDWADKTSFENCFRRNIVFFWHLTQHALLFFMKFKKCCVRKNNDSKRAFLKKPLHFYSLISNDCPFFWSCLHMCNYYPWGPLPGNRKKEIEIPDKRGRGDLKLWGWIILGVLLRVIEKKSKGKYRCNVERTLPKLWDLIIRLLTGNFPYKSVSFRGYTDVSGSVLGFVFEISVPWLKKRVIEINTKGEFRLSYNGQIRRRRSSLCQRAVRTGEYYARLASTGLWW